MKAKQLLAGQRVKILSDRRIQTKRPVIYAATHIGWDDIEMILCSLKQQAYLLWGDPRELYRSIEGFLLNINGVVCVDTTSKKDRYIAKENCVKLLQSGGNLLIFPEGAWNITENLPVMHLYSGAVEMAVRTGAEIIPVAIECYGKKYIVNFGKNIDFSTYTLDCKKELTEKLRDELATLRWEIWESVPTTKRHTLPSNYSDLYLNTFAEQMGNVYSIDDVYQTCYHPKGVTPSKEAFAHLENLVLCKENVFLFDKRASSYYGRTQI